VDEWSMKCMGEMRNEYIILENVELRGLGIGGRIVLK
jgi:hypothetical protein